jgi:hypothetical protein
LKHNFVGRKIRGGIFFEISRLNYLISSKLPSYSNDGAGVTLVNFQGQLLKQFFLDSKGQILECLVFNATLLSKAIFSNFGIVGGIEWLKGI